MLIRLIFEPDPKVNVNHDKMFEEPGKNNAGDNGDPFEVSDADTMIKYLKENAR